MNIKQRAHFVQMQLEARYPTPETHLAAQSPWQLLVAVVLSAQCTDARVNMVTPELFRRWPTSAAIEHAKPEDVEAVIHSTGFYRAKTRHILASAKIVRERFAGEVPRTQVELMQLPGVARKTANVVLWGAFGLNEGVAVDTHVGRIAYRLGLTTFTDPLRVEHDLMQLFPREQWGLINHRMVWFGRHVCQARKPLCTQCELAEYCPRKHPPRATTVKHKKT